MPDESVEPIESILHFSPFPYEEDGRWDRSRPSGEMSNRVDEVRRQTAAKEGITPFKYVPLGLECFLPCPRQWWAAFWFVRNVIGWGFLSMYIHLYRVIINLIPN